ncbi:MAG: gliding motility-associated C-terminal domain-containing protein [Bacteroidota bacterium]
MSRLKIYLFLLCFTTLKFYSQTACTSASAFCANNTTGTTFPAGVGNASAGAGPDYGCLATTPNPAWYYFQVSQNGVINIGISGTGGGDVDFICWGPFTSPTGNCGNLTAANTVDCSYSGSATETVTINNAVAGQYYQLLLTNYANTPQNINFNQVGGTGSTNCGLIAPVTSATICAGQTATIYANTNLTSPTFAWSPGGMTTQTITVSPAVTTVYTVTVSGLNPSSTPTTVVGTGTVTVSPPTPVTVTPASSSICLGQSVGLSASGAGPFVWSASTGTAPASAANVTVTPGTTTTYTVVSGVGTCSTSAVATVSITLTPSISITPSLSTICSGQSAILTSSGNAPFNWSSSSGPIFSSSATITVFPSLTTTYTVISGAGTCTASAVATVSVGTPTPTAITPTLSSVCAGQSVGLSASGTGPFIWSASTGTAPASAANVTVTPGTTTTYTVVSGAGTCTSSAVATVSISLTPTISITPSVSTICVGQNAVLTASGSGPFTWTASSGPNPSNTATITVSPTTTTTYTVVSGPGTCTTSAVATVSIGATPPINITPSNTTICLGAAVNLSSTGSGPFTWTASNGPAPASSANVTVTPSATTTYTVLSGTGACTATAVASISVNITPTIVITPTLSTICSGQNTTFTATGGTTYTWTTTPGNVTSSGSNFSLSPINSTSVVISSAVGNCTGYGLAIIVVLPDINPMITASSPTVCITNTVTLAAASGVGLTYTWQPSGAISGANNTSTISAMPPTTTTVIYTVTVSNGVCSSSDTIQLKIKTPPSINNFSTLNNDTICVGGCVTFSANTSGSMPIYYQWYYESGVGTSSVGIAPEACYPSAGSFSVIATASNTCGADTMTKTNFVTVFDMPVLMVHGDTTINIGETAEVFASGGLSYSWSSQPVDPNMACPTCSNTVVQPTVTTEYIVVASNSRYCKIQDTVRVIVDINCGDFFIPNVFSPNDDGLNDVINVHGRCISTYNLQIFSRWGEKVFETSTQENSWDGTFRGKKLDTGVFVYRADGVSIDGQSFNMKGNITLIR